MLFTAAATLALLCPGNTPPASSSGNDYSCTGKPGMCITRDTTAAASPNSGYHIYFGKYQECAPGMKVVVKGRDFYCDPKDSLTSKIENMLLQDGLISDRGNYSFSFTNKSLTVNGKKQSPEMWRKYKTLIEDTTGHKIGSSYSYAITKIN